jgi:hypothetical protein
MAFQTPITIQKVLERIQAREYVLPAIQREFVWDRDQICALFDSLMRRYPIGSFLFWKVEQDRSLDFRFYEFMTRYHERDFHHNPYLHIVTPQALTAILDGQQRLSSLAIGILGDHTEKLPRKWASSPDAFPKTHLYLDLCHEPDDQDDELGLQYRFEFHTKTRVDADNAGDSGIFWYRVGDIRTTENGPPLLEYLQQHQLAGDALSRAFKTLDRLWSMVHQDPVISYHEEEDQDIDRVLDIFIRVNSGGTKLSFSDLLLSIATAQWKERDARESVHAVVDDMNRTGQGFAFSKDLVLKSALVLTDVGSIRFHVKNFTQGNMVKIEAGWSGIERSLRIGARLLASFGFSERTLVADSVLIPIADYVHMRELDDGFLTRHEFAEDRKRIRSWTIRSLLRAGVWGSGLDSLLTELRKVVRDHGRDGLPLADLEAAMARQGKSLRFEPEELEDLADMEFGNRRLFPLLALLYPGVDVRNEFHIDHVFPKSKLTEARLRSAGLDDDAVADARYYANTIANLQLLEGPFNEAKLAKLPRDWATERFGAGSAELQHYLAVNDLDGLPAGVEDFTAFAEQRRAKIRERLGNLLEVSESPAKAAAGPVATVDG